jgi:hypothetical protein
MKDEIAGDLALPTIHHPRPAEKRKLSGRLTVRVATL